MFMSLFVDLRKNVRARSRVQPLKSKLQSAQVGGEELSLSSMHQRLVNQNGAFALRIGQRLHATLSYRNEGIRRM